MADDWSRYIADVTPLKQVKPHYAAPTHRLHVAPYHASPVLDLHGMSVQEAYRATRAFFDNPAGSIVITGLTGAIRAEFPAWCAQQNSIRTIEPFNGGGAFRLKRRR